MLENNPQRPHEDQENDNRLTVAIGQLHEIYTNSSPELQSSLGGLAAYLYLTVLLTPEKLPSMAQTLLSLLDVLPMGKETLWISTLFATGLTLDGLRRVIVERFPVYRAFIDVFVLNKKID